MKEKRILKGRNTRHQGLKGIEKKLIAFDQFSALTTLVFLRKKSNSKRENKQGRKQARKVRYHKRKFGQEQAMSENSCGFAGNIMHV